jgi:hypothetical protein
MPPAASPPPELDAIVARWRRGERSIEMTIMELLCTSESVEASLAAARGTALATAIDEHRAGCERVCAMLASGTDSSEPFESVAAGLTRVRRLFDTSVETDAALSVALYSLGSPAILARATDEVVALLDAWGVLASDVRALDLGCGTGRLLPPIAARVSAVTGIDLSPKMVAAARARCAALSNVTVELTHGRDLSGLTEGAFELVYAVDSFPYVVQAGPALVRDLFGEIRRVLAPAGRFVLLSFSYREDDALDRADVADAAARSGLTVEIDGDRPFRLWSALAFRLRA